MKLLGCDINLPFIHSNDSTSTVKEESDNNKISNIAKKALAYLPYVTSAAAAATAAIVAYTNIRTTEKTPPTTEVAQIVPQVIPDSPEEIHWIPLPSQNPLTPATTLSPYNRNLDITVKTICVLIQIPLLSILALKCISSRTTAKAKKAADLIHETATTIATKTNIAQLTALHTEATSAMRDLTAAGDRVTWIHSFRVFRTIPLMERDLEQVEEHQTKARANLRAIHTHICTATKSPMERLQEIQQEFNQSYSAYQSLHDDGPKKPATKGHTPIDYDKSLKKQLDAAGNLMSGFEGTDQENAATIIYDDLRDKYTSFQRDHAPASTALEEGPKEEFNDEALEINAEPLETLLAPKLQTGEIEDKDLRVLNALPYHIAIDVLKAPANRDEFESRVNKLRSKVPCKEVTLLRNKLNELSITHREAIISLGVHQSNYEYALAHNNNYDESED